MEMPSVKQLIIEYDGVYVNVDLRYDIHASTVQQLIKDALHSSPDGYKFVKVAESE